MDTVVGQNERLIANEKKRGERERERDCIEG